MSMIIPAVITPQKIDSSARVLGILSSVAISAPDHAPVPGSGTATKTQAGVFRDLTALAEQLFLIGRGEFLERRQGFRPLEQLFAEHEQQRDGQHIAEYRQRKQRRPRDTGGRAERYGSAQLYERHHRDNKNGCLAPCSEQPVK